MLDAPALEGSDMKRRPGHVPVGTSIQCRGDDDPYPLYPGYHDAEIL